MSSFGGAQSLLEYLWETTLKLILETETPEEYPDLMKTDDLSDPAESSKARILKPQPKVGHKLLHWQ